MRIDDGYQTTVAFAKDANVLFWEKNVTPPSMDGGGENDTTTMHNEKYRTKMPKALISLGNMTLNCAYDPKIYTSILTMLNVNQEITVTFPDKSTYKFWGWINSFTPSSIEEGSQPTADVEIICSNTNASKEEVAPVFTDAPVVP